MYPNPRIFRPERFLKIDGLEPVPDPEDISFGFGRRICPGRHVADSAMFVTMARLLAAYKINKAVDKEGRVVEPTLDLEPGLVSHPRPFEALFTLRNSKYEEMIRAVEREHPLGSSDAEILSNVKWTASPSLYE